MGAGGGEAVSNNGSPQFSCRVELSQTGGILIVIKDSKRKDDFARTIALNRASITVTCKDGTKVSTVTQTDSSLKLEVRGDDGVTTIDQDTKTVAVKCSVFKVDAETITLKATGDGSFETDGSCRVTTQGDCALQSSSKLSLSSMQKLSAHSDTEIGADAMTISLDADVQMSLAAKTVLEAKSGGSASLKALAVDVQGDATASLKAPMTSMGGAGRTSVSGGIVQVSGALVQLG